MAEQKVNVLDFAVLGMDQAHASLFERSDMLKHAFSLTGMARGGLRGGARMLGRGAAATVRSPVGQGALIAGGGWGMDAGIRGYEHLRGVPEAQMTPWGSYGNLATVIGAGRATTGLLGAAGRNQRLFHQTRPVTTYAPGPAGPFQNVTHPHIGNFANYRIGQGLRVAPTVGAWGTPVGIAGVLGHGMLNSHSAGAAAGHDQGIRNTFDVINGMQNPDGVALTPATQQVFNQLQQTNPDAVQVLQNGNVRFVGAGQANTGATGGPGPGQPGPTGAQGPVNPAGNQPVGPPNTPGTDSPGPGPDASPEEWEAYLHAMSQGGSSPQSGRTGIGAIDSLPNWGKGIGVGLGALGVGGLAHALSGYEEDELGQRKKKRAPWLGPLAAAGALGAGAYWLKGNHDWQDMLKPEFWKASSAQTPLILLSYRIKLGETVPNPASNPVPNPAPNPAAGTQITPQITNAMSFLGGATMPGGGAMTNAAGPVAQTIGTNQAAQPTRPTAPTVPGVTYNPQNRPTGLSQSLYGVTPPNEMQQWAGFGSSLLGMVPQRVSFMGMNAQMPQQVTQVAQGGQAALSQFAGPGAQAPTHSQHVQAVGNLHQRLDQWQQQQAARAEWMRRNPGGPPAGHDTPWLQPGQEDQSAFFRGLQGEDRQHAYDLLFSHTYRPTPGQPPDAAALRSNQLFQNFQQATGWTPPRYVEQGTPAAAQAQTQQAMQAAGLLGGFSMGGVGGAGGTASAGPTAASAAAPQTREVPAGTTQAMARRMTELYPESQDQATQLQNLHHQLSQRQPNNPGIWETVMRVWSQLDPMQKILVGGGLSLGAIGLLGLLTGNQTIGGSTGMLLGLGGLAAAVFSSGLLDEHSPLRRGLSSLFGGRAHTNGPPPPPEPITQLNAEQLVHQGITGQQFQQFWERAQRGLHPVSGQPLGNNPQEAQQEAMRIMTGWVAGFTPDANEAMTRMLQGNQAALTGFQTLRQGIPGYMRWHQEEVSRYAQEHGAQLGFIGPPNAGQGGGPPIAAAGPAITHPNQSPYFQSHGITVDGHGHLGINLQLLMGGLVTQGPDGRPAPNAQGIAAFGGELARLPAPMRQNIASALLQELHSTSEQYPNVVSPQQVQQVQLMLSSMLSRMPGAQPPPTGGPTGQTGGQTGQPAPGGQPIPGGQPAPGGAGPARPNQAGPARTAQPIRMQYVHTAVQSFLHRTTAPNPQAPGPQPIVAAFLQDAQQYPEQAVATLTAAEDELHTSDLAPDRMHIAHAAITNAREGLAEQHLLDVLNNRQGSAEWAMQNLDPATLGSMRNLLADVMSGTVQVPGVDIRTRAAELNALRDSLQQARVDHIAAAPMTGSNILALREFMADSRVSDAQRTELLHRLTPEQRTAIQAYYRQAGRQSDADASLLFGINNLSSDPTALPRYSRNTWMAGLANEDSRAPVQAALLRRFTGANYHTDANWTDFYELAGRLDQFAQPLPPNAPPADIAARQRAFGILQQGLITAGIWPRSYGNQTVHIATAEAHDGGGGVADVPTTPAEFDRIAAAVRQLRPVIAQAHAFRQLHRQNPGQISTFDPRRYFSNPAAEQANPGLHGLNQIVQHHRETDDHNLAPDHEDAPYFPYRAVANPYGFTANAAEAYPTAANAPLTNVHHFAHANTTPARLNTALATMSRAQQRHLLAHATQLWGPDSENSEHAGGQALIRSLQSRLGVVPYTAPETPEAPEPPPGAFTSLIGVTDPGRTNTLLRSMSDANLDSLQGYLNRLEQHTPQTTALRGIVTTESVRRYNLEVEQTRADDAAMQARVLTPFAMNDMIHQWTRLHWNQASVQPMTEALAQLTRPQLLQLQNHLVNRPTRQYDPNPQNRYQPRDVYHLNYQGYNGAVNRVGQAIAARLAQLPQ